MGVVEGALHDTPCFLACCAKGGFRAGEPDVVGALLRRAVHVNVVDVRVGCDDNIGIGHGAGVGASAAAQNGSFGYAVVREGKAFRHCVVQREAHRFAAAGVEHIIIFDARAVTGDAAGAVCSGRSGILHGDIIARRDAAGLLALGGAEGAGVVAVGVGGHRPVAGKGGSAADEGPDIRGAVEAVGDGERAFISLPAHEAAAVGGGACATGNYPAVEHAALDVEVGVVAVALVADESTVCAVAIDTARDGDAGAAVADGDGAVLVGGNACCIHGRGGNFACNDEVLNHAAVLDVAEGGCISLAGVVVEGQRVPLPVEGAAEVALTAASHAVDANVRAEFHGLAAEAVVGGDVLQGVAELAPACGIVDGVFRAVSVDREVV